VRTSWRPTDDFPAIEEPGQHTLDNAAVRSKHREGTFVLEVDFAQKRRRRVLSCELRPVETFVPRKRGGSVNGRSDNLKIHCDLALFFGSALWRAGF